MNDRAWVMVVDRMGEFEVIEYKGVKLLVFVWKEVPFSKLRLPEIVIPLQTLDPTEAKDPQRTSPRYVCGAVLPATILAGTPSVEDIRRFQPRKGPPLTFPVETTQ